MMIDIRQTTKPYPVNTASKTLWIKEACDLLLNGVVIRDCLSNPSNMETTRMSEGVLEKKKFVLKYPLLPPVKTKLFEKWELPLGLARERNHDA